MIRKQPIIAIDIESENELKFYNLEAWNIKHRMFCGDCVDMHTNLGTRWSHMR